MSMSRVVEEKPNSGETARLVVSCVLFVHLFAVLVASIHGARARSAMVRRLQDNLVGPYAQALNVGQYSYHLTYALDFDLDHNCDVLVNWQPEIGDTAEAPQSVTRIPLYGARHAFPRHRERRYQMLARNVDLAGNSGESSGTLVPLAVARTLLAENSLTGGEHHFRCRVTQVPRPPWMEGLQPPPVQNVFRANVVFQAGLAQLVEDAPGAQVAPVDRPRSGPTRTTQPRPNTSPGTSIPPKAKQHGERK
jgi:hypothetical protein